MSRSRPKLTGVRHSCFLPLLPLFLLTSVNGIHLDTLFAHGDSSIAIEWTPDSANTDPEWYRIYGTGCTGADSIFRHCDFIPDETYRGVAYSYGGEDGYLRFREKVESGFLVGSHLCHYNSYGDPSPVVAGTDCSGFVCYLWDVPRVSTRGLHADYAEISREELDAGDILVKPGSHALLIVERDEGTRYLIWESTSVVNGCRERIIDISDDYWDAYYARRYEGIVTNTKVPHEQRLQGMRFPFVSKSLQAIELSSPSLWKGVITLCTLNGRQLYSGSYKVISGKPVRISLPRIQGICLIQLSSNAKRIVIPLHTVHL